MLPAALPASHAADHRLFVALLPEPAVQQVLVAHRAHWHWPAGARPTRAERLHLTLRMPLACDALAESRLHEALATVQVPPMRLVLRSAIVFRGGTAVLLPEPSEALQYLHARLNDALAAFGFARETQWQPHVTLARQAGNAAPPEAFAPIVWPVRAMALVWSQLPPTFAAARYVTLARYGAAPGAQQFW